MRGGAGGRRACAMVRGLPKLRRKPRQVAMVMPAATGKRLSWNGGTEYSAPTAVPNAKSTWISGEKVARTTARPPAPAASTSAHATRGEMRPAATGRNGLFTSSISTS